MELMNSGSNFVNIHLLSMFKKYSMMKTINICISFFLLSLFGHSQPQWVGFSGNQPSKPQVNLMISTNQKILYQVQIPGMNQESRTFNGITYQRLSMLGGQKWGDPGYPELPSIGKLLAIPECTGMDISVVFTDSIVFDGYNVYPTPTIVKDTSGGSPHLVEQFVKNDSIYGLNQSFPSVSFKSEDGGYLRSQKILKMSVFPFKYNPVSQQLVVYTQFQVAILFQSPQNEVNISNGYFSHLSKKTLLNYTPDQPIPPCPPGGNPTPGTVTWVTLNDTSDAVNIVADYLIITDDQFFNPQHSTALLTLANHRAHFNGFDVVIASVQNILNLNFAYDPPYDPNWISERKIRQFIKRVYDGQHAAHTYDGKVAFVCLVGKAYPDGNDTGVPTSYDPDPTCNPQNNMFFAANDYYFSCVTKDGSNHWDIIGDVFIGRLSADNSTELSNLVTKTIHNENEYSIDSWKRKNTLIFGGTFTGMNVSIN